MIRHLPHAAIDKQRWDEALGACANRLWYAQSWVLDRVSPGWEALLDEEQGAMMPLTRRRKWGIDYLFQPLGVQQLGVFASQPDEGLEAAFLERMPSRFRYADIQLNEAMGAGPFKGFTQHQRTNQVLSLGQPIAALRAAYSPNHRRNLRAADHGLLTDTMPVSEFVALFRSTTGARFGPGAVRGLEAFGEALAGGVARGQCEVVALSDGSARIAAACFATWGGRTILLKAANTVAGQRARAMFRIVDAWIAQHAGQPLLMDFAGSETPSVARFNAGFGAQPRVYLRLVRNRLPAPLRLIKR